MAIKSQAQIQAESNSTYVDNTVGSITPANVRTLNTNWIDSIIYVEQTGSMQVLSASFATNSATASFLIGSIASASFANSAVSASQAEFANTASLALQNIVTASAVANILTFTKGNGTAFNVTIAQSGSVASASYADVANFANSANSASYAFTASSATNAANSISASFAVSASRAISAATAVSATSATSALTSISASFATTAGTVVGGATLSGNNVFTGVNTFNNAVTMSNVQVNGTASIAFLNVVFQSSSIIYSSGSNQLGDAANDTQTLYGTVNVITGPLVVTGSSNFRSAFTASGLTYPAADGLVDQFLTTNGTGNLSFSNLDTILEDVVSGEGFTKGDPLYISGSQGAKPIVYKADASDASKMPVVYVAYETVPTTGVDTRGIVLGLIEGMPLTGYEAGDEVYVAEGGGWTSTRPTGSNSIVQFLGVITKPGSGGKGLVLNPGPATLPNLESGYAWVGDASNQPIPTLVSTLSVATAVSSSFATSASFASQAGSVLTASFVANAFISASQVGGNDKVSLTNAQGTTTTLTINNVDSANNASTANTATSASFATTSNTSISASFAQLAATASFFDGLVASASYAILAETANNANTANVANSALTAISADTASFTPNAFVSASNTVVNDQIAFFKDGNPLTNNVVTINNVQSASYADNATSASFAQTSVTASFATNFVNSGSYVITGSHRGNVVSQSIASSTASFDFSTGNFFTLNLTGSTLTHISASNIQAGQTVNLRISQGATTGSVSFSPAFDQVSGSEYVPTQVANAVDILTFITFDNTNVYVSNIKNLV